MHLVGQEDINMAALEEWTPESHEWQPEQPESYSPDENTEDNLKELKKKHPYLIGLSEAIQKHPAINKSIEKSAPYIEHFNRAVQGTGLPNLSKGFFVGSDKLLRMLMNATPTGIAPPVNVPSPGWEEKQIPEVNPKIQRGAEILGETLPDLASFETGKPALTHLGHAFKDLPLTQKMASRSLREAKGLAENREIGSLDVPDELIQDLKQFLPETTPYKKLLERAMNKDYQSLFDLQSDVGKHSRDYIKSLFSAAERAHGREGAAARNRLLDAMREHLSSTGNLDIAELMKHGQNRYRQYMKLRPYRNAALAAPLAGTPAYKHIKKYLSD